MNGSPFHFSLRTMDNRLCRFPIELPDRSVTVDALTLICFNIKMIKKIVQSVHMVTGFKEKIAPAIYRRMIIFIAHKSIVLPCHC